MKTTDVRSLMLAFRAWLDDDERNAEQIARHVIDRACGGHFAFFRLLIDLVDGKIRQTAEEEMTGDADCVVVVADDGQDAETAMAA